MSRIHLNIITLDYENSNEYDARMKNIIFARYFSQRGALRKASRESGIPYVTLIQHANNRRKVSSNMALRYEKLLGIPRWELRPDLWDRPEESPKGKD